MRNAVLYSDCGSAVVRSGPQWSAVSAIVRSSPKYSAPVTGGCAGVRRFAQRSGVRGPRRDPRDVHRLLDLDTPCLTSNRLPSVRGVAHRTGEFPTIADHCEPARTLRSGADHCAPVLTNCGRCRLMRSTSDHSGLLRTTADHCGPLRTTADRTPQSEYKTAFRTEFPNPHLACDPQCRWSAPRSP